MITSSPNAGLVEVDCTTTSKEISYNRMAPPIWSSLCKRSLCFLFAIGFLPTRNISEKRHIVARVSGNLAQSMAHTFVFHCSSNLFGARKQLRKSFPFMSHLKNRLNLGEHSSILRECTSTTATSAASSTSTCEGTRSLADTTS